MKDVLLSYPAILSFWKWVADQPTLVLIGLGLISLCVVYVGQFLLKNLILWLLRLFGLSTPRLYGKFPTLPWRPFIRTYLSFKAWQDSVFKIGKHASGGYASILSILCLTPKNDAIPLGLPWLWGLKCFQTVYQKIETHMMIVAQSGAGKSVFLKTVLAEWSSSIFCIDPKGEFYRDILCRKTSHQIVALRPYDAKTSGQINVFDCLREAAERGGESEAIRWAYRIGGSFINTEPDSRNRYFTETAMGYLVGLVLFVESHFPLTMRNLGTVRDLIIHGMPVYDEYGELKSTREEAVKNLNNMMMDSVAYSGAIPGAAAPFITASKETLGNLQSTLQNATKVLDIPSVRHMLSATTRSIRELKTQRDYVLTIEASVTSLREELKDIARLITNMVVYTFEAETNINGQCLAVLEEFSAQGYNPCIETALPLARSQGLILMPAVQDLDALKAAYPKTYLSFIGNSCATVWMSSSHPSNLSQLARQLGKRAHIEIDPQTGKKHIRETDVSTPEQLGRFLSKTTGNMIVTRAGARALRLKLNPHYQALPVWAYMADPDHREALSRALTRFVLRLFNFPKTPKTFSDNNDTQQMETR